VAAYLIDQELPPPGTVCAEDVPPFGASEPEDAGRATPAPSS
jgi:hypothetical protein